MVVQNMTVVHVSRVQTNTATDFTGNTVNYKTPNRLAACNVHQKRGS